MPPTVSVVENPPQNRRLLHNPRHAALVERTDGAFEVILRDLALQVETLVEVPVVQEQVWAVLAEIEQRAALRGFRRLEVALVARQLLE